MLTKKIILHLTFWGSLSLIAPSILNVTHAIVKNISDVITFSFSKVNVLSQTDFSNSKTFEDNGGNIWISSDKGLFKSVDKGATFTEAGASNKTLPAGVPNHLLLQDQSNNIWVLSGTNTNLTLYKSADGINFSQVNFPSNGTTITYFKMISDSRNTLWVATNAGLFESSNLSTFLKVTTGLPANFSPLDIFQASNGAYFAADATHVYSSPYGMTFTQDKGTGLPTTMGTPGTINTYPTFYQAPNGNVYLSTNQEAFKCTNAVNPLTLDTFIQIGNNLGYKFLSSIYVDKTSGIWISENNGANTNVGESFESVDNGLTFQGMTSAKNTITNGFFQDKEGSIWAENTNGLQVSSYGSNFSNSNYLPNSNVSSLFQDLAGNIWVTSNIGVYKSLSESYKNTGYTTQGKVYKQKYENLNYIFSSNSFLFYAGDSTVTTVVLNGATTNVNGAGFSQVLNSKTNNGKYNITVNYSDGTVANYNFYVVQNNEIGQLLTNKENTMKKYIAKLNNKNINYIFIQGIPAGAAPNLEIKLGITGFDPIPDASNSYYSQVDPKTFNIKPGTQIALTNDTNIDTPGFYFVHLTDKVGNSIEYYVQIGWTNDKPYLPPINPLIPIVRPMMKITKPTMPLFPSSLIPKVPYAFHLTAMDEIIISFAVGATSVAIIAGVFIYFLQRANKKNKNIE